MRTTEISVFAENTDISIIYSAFCLNFLEAVSQAISAALRLCLSVYQRLTMPKLPESIRFRVKLSALG